MSFLVGVNRSRSEVVVYHKETKRRFDMNAFDAIDIANDDGDKYHLSDADVVIGVKPEDVEALRSDIKGVIKFLDLAI